MNFDDLFDELEAKFEALLSRRHAAESTSSLSTFAVTLLVPIALPRKSESQPMPLAQTLTLNHASIGSDCIAGFDQSLDYWLLIRLDSVSDIRIASNDDHGALHFSEPDFSFDSLLSGLDLPGEIWIRRGQETRFTRGHLAGYERPLLRLGFGIAEYCVPAIGVNALAVQLSS